MTADQWTAWSQITQGFGSILTVLVTLYIAVLVQNYTRKKDKFDIVRYKWGEQQSLNIAMLSRDENMVEFEKIVYGSDFNVDANASRKYYLIFTVMNGLQHFFYSYEHKLISRGDLEAYCLPSVSLLKNEEQLVVYLLRERGYSAQFADFLSTLLKRASRPNPPVAYDQRI